MLPEMEWEKTRLGLFLIGVEEVEGEPNKGVQNEGV